MRTTSSISLLAALGLLSLSTPAAQAAPAKVGVKAASGGVTVQVKNPNRYAIKGSVSLQSGAKTVSAKRATVKAKRSTSLSLPAGGAGSVTVVAKFGKPGAKPKVTRTTVKVGSNPAPRPASGLGASSVGAAPGPATGVPTGGSTLGGGATDPSTGPGKDPVTDPPPAPSKHWTGRFNSDGELFGFTLDNGVINLDSIPLTSVYCQENGGSNTAAWSYEAFDRSTGWLLGNQSTVQQKDTSRVNRYAGTSAHRVTYRLSTSQTGTNAISGSFYQSFPSSEYVYGGSVRTWTCSGTDGFTATRDQ